MENYIRAFFTIVRFLLPIFSVILVFCSGAGLLSKKKRGYKVFLLTDDMKETEIKDGEYIIGSDDDCDIILDKYAVAKENIVLNVTVSDLNEKYVLYFRNGVLLVQNGTHSDDADVSVTCPRPVLLYLLQGNAEDFIRTAKVEGDVEKLMLIAENLNELSAADVSFFNIVEP